MVSQSLPLKQRHLYLQRLIGFQDQDLVKVVTGIRRCGKSSLLKLMAQHLRQEGVDESQIIEMNFESMRYQSMTAQDLYSYVMDLAPAGKRMYLFFDELQKVPDWQSAISSFRVDLDCDIYITGSNAYLLSSEFATYLSGRYVEIKVYPLSFKEFLDFHDMAVDSYETPMGEKRYRVRMDDGRELSLEDAYETYVFFGGLPGLVDAGFSQEKAFTMLDGIYSTVVMRDILERGRREGEKRVADAQILRRISYFLADNIGNVVSSRSMQNTLQDDGAIAAPKRLPAQTTVQTYMQALVDAFVFYEAKRYDIKGRDYLRTMGKYYMVDMGLRNFLLGYKMQDTGHILENIIYFELLRRGYDVSIGKLKNLEIDFVAHKVQDRLYVQVTQDMTNPETRERELRSLLAVPDAYPKMILTLGPTFGGNIEGVIVKNALEWLLEET